jgi:hypothetical protein
MALSKPARIVLIILVALFATCTMCSVGTCLISRDQHRQLDEARAACRYPNVYRLREGGNTHDTADWQCLPRQVVAAREQARHEADTKAGAKAAKATTDQQAPAVVDPAVEKALALAPIKAALSDLAGQPQDDAEKILASARRLKAVQDASPDASSPELTDLQTKVAEVVSGTLGSDPPAPPPGLQLEEPQYVEPEYTGATKLAGAYRGPYEGGLFSGTPGVVVQNGDNYSVVHGAEAASIFTTRFDGYVTPTKTALGFGSEQATVTLNIGRVGREAKEYNYADRETYNDDKQAYAERVKVAKAQHDAVVKAYREQAKANQKVLDDIRSQQRERDGLIREKRNQIKALPGAADKALKAL